MKHKALLSIFIIVFSLFTLSVANACMGPMSETQTYLTKTPDNATTKEFVGEVLILETYIDEKTQDVISKVSVTTVIKGLEEYQTFTVISERHSCARDSEVKVGEKYFIAGNFIDDQNTFRGTWKGLEYDLYWKLESPTDK